MRRPSVQHALAGRFFPPLLVLLGFCLLSRCAREVAPRGGPEDKTPPRIAHVSPENKATLVARDHRVEFEFSEAMNRKSLENAIFISPDPGDGVRFKWKGRRLRILFPDSLSADRTYVITLGTGLLDSHGNALTRSFTLAFSTGERISSGTISGRVYSEKPKGILIWAYILEGNEEPDPRRKSAAYATQTDNRGRFELSNLSAGPYRIFAIQDNDANRFFEPGIDGIGVPFGDVDLLHDTLTVTNVNFKISTQDTLGPALLAVSAEDALHLTLQFDEALRPEGVDSTSKYAIVRRKTREDSLRVFQAYLNSLDAREVKLTTALQTAGTDYTVSVRGLRDLAGNVVDPEFSSQVFSGAARPDTLRPRVVKSVPPDSARAVATNAKIELHFSEAIEKDALIAGVTLNPDAGAQISGTWTWETPASVVFQPQRELRSKSRYEVAVALDSVVDIAGNAAGDSTFTFAFTVINIDTLSLLSGRISDPDSAATGPIIVTARQSGAVGQVYQFETAQPGEYVFKDILPGIYSIEAFRDSDANGKYSFGTLLPFQAAERFVVYPDTVKIRARWPNEGNDMVLPKQGSSR